VDGQGRKSLIFRAQNATRDSCARSAIQRKSLETKSKARIYLRALKGDSFRLSNHKFGGRSDDPAMTAYAQTNVTSGTAAVAFARAMLKPRPSLGLPKAELLLLSRP
jgi:hypothetical protein